MSGRAAISLGSGAARGYAHIAVIQHLLENDVEIQHVSGASIGSVIGAYYCLNGEVDTLYKAQMEMGYREFSAMLDPNFPTRSLLKGDKIANWLRKKYFGKKTFADLETPLVLCAVDLDEQELVYFEDGDLVKAIRASASLPGFLAPYKYKGKHFLDGGVIDPLPVDILLQKGYEKVIAINLNKYSFKCNSDDIGIKSILTQTFFLMMRTLAERSMDPERTFEISPKFDLGITQMLDFTGLAPIHKVGDKAMKASWPELQSWLSD